MCLKNENISRLSDCRYELMFVFFALIVSAKFLAMVIKPIRGRPASGHGNFSRYYEQREANLAHFPNSS